MSDSNVNYENGFIIFFDDINTVVPQEKYREQINHIIVEVGSLKNTQELSDLLDGLYTEKSEIRQEIARQNVV